MVGSFNSKVISDFAGSSKGLKAEHGQSLAKTRRNVVGSAENEQTGEEFSSIPNCRVCGLVVVVATKNFRSCHSTAGRFG
jgi:hypothetical protein